ncbi:MAG TPA: chemotaxis protein CheC [Lachnospiraceae bacterium]|nr:chemotaxis protein CheC [Lachnospiraceae bacterium]
MKQDEMYYDIITELFNISVGKAAGILSEIVNRKIILDVPEIKLILKEEDAVDLDACISDKISGALMVSSISFENNLKGKANLIFPTEKMKKFIHLCMNEEVAGKDDFFSISEEEMDFTPIDFDVIMEIGNIVLNCIMGEIGNFLKVNFNYSLPDVKIFDRQTFYNDSENDGYSHVLVLHITFVIDEIEIEGAIIVDLTLSSIQILLEKIKELEAEFHV